MLMLPALSACNGGGDPESEGTPTPKFSEAPSESASASPSPSASGSAEVDPQTPEQVVEAFVAGVSRAINTGDTSAFMRFVKGKRCGNCLALARNIRRAYSSGQSFETSGWVVATMKSSTTDEGVVRVRGLLDISSQRTLDASGEVVDQSVAETRDYSFEVARVDGQPRITYWGLEQ
ncbi:hypothetical protein K8W59_11255 [Nocardioides rotundus]|uniref:hypothetical protein n=1 Tax=Nocardioides rotundus TaxID=1774216 RepID=UPI001CBCE7AF|nr:hypothetical protein [Nocardioides rotundus]UAL28457.1 hypothetical protein K8W59_11255 [Nocardioides rotundus]